MSEPQIFVSYSHSDGDFAKDLISRLKKSSDYTTWIDAKDLRGGDDWQEAIDNAILSSFAVILVMSKEARISEYVTYEWAFAAGASATDPHYNITIFPVYIEKPTDVGIHARLHATQYYDFSDSSKRAWKKLDEDLRNALLKNRVGGGTDELLKALLDESEPQRAVRAAAAFGLARVMKAIPRLIKALDLFNDHIAVKVAAANALGEIGNISAVPGLQKAADGLHPEVRVAALMALGKISEISTCLGGSKSISKFLDAGVSKRVSRPCKSTKSFRRL